MDIKVKKTQNKKKKKKKREKREKKGKEKVTIRKFDTCLCDGKCRDWVLALLLEEKRIRAQLAQYNKFVESRFKN